MCMDTNPKSSQLTMDCCPRLSHQGHHCRKSWCSIDLLSTNGAWKRAAVTHRTGSVQWTWKKTAEEHDDTIAMNEYRTIRAHPAHLDLPKLKKSRANAKNEHGNSWPFSTLGPLHWRIVQTRILSCERWLPNVHSHPLHKNCPLRIAIMKKEPGSEDESEEEIMPTWCTHHLPPKKHPRKSKNRRETKKNGDRKPTCD